MAEIISHFTRGVSCDNRKCDSEISGEWVSIWDERYVEQALEAGWTFWAGRRTRRAYCSPECGPMRGHRMSQVEVRR